MIKADGIIDSREMESLSSMMGKYGIKAEDKINSESITLSKAIRTLRDNYPSLGQDILGDVTNIALSDNYCSIEEALLLLGLIYVFSEKKKHVHADILSVTTPDMFFPTSQILYIESNFDEYVNNEISSHLREIVAVSRLAGFDFVYIPKIVGHYRQLTNEQLSEMISFLYPQASSDKINAAIQQLQNFTTSQFCQNLLASKLKIQDIEDTPPALMIKIGNSLYNHKLYSNYLILEMEENVVGSIFDFLETFTSLYQTRILDYLEERPNRFIFRGFYRQLLELIMLRKGVKSSVLIDTDRGEIIFPEADVRIENLHRREKALYALFLTETPSGGINFTKPDTAKQLERYDRRMKALQAKYNLIYEKFGGDRDKAPRIDVAETRLPMISLIKRQIMKLKDVLYHVDDYIVQRNLYGNYGVKLSANDCLCRNFGEKDVTPIVESASWQRILAL